MAEFDPKPKRRMILIQNQKEMDDFDPKLIRNG
jgi:hypothetical protein